MFTKDLPRLHEYYKSPFIRLGPNLVSCSDPATIEYIYGFHNQLRKSDLTKPMVPIFKRRRLPTMFLAASPQEHQAIRAPVAGAYTMTNVLQGEGRVDRSMKDLFQRLVDLFASTGRPCDIHNWVHYFSADVMFDLTMGEPIGLVQAGGDVDGVLDTMAKEFDYRGLVLAMPLIDDLIRLNPFQAIFKPNQMPASVSRAYRLLNQARTIGLSGKSDEVKPRPLVYDFLQAAEKNPEIDEPQLMGYIQQNVSAGADTTSIILRTAIYCSLKSPWIREAILKELDANDVHSPVPYRQARFELKFCAAVIRESLRWSFPFVALMERQVPDGPGLILPGGVRLAPGTAVGVHPGFVQRNKVVFGQDADDFNPLRWFPGPGESQIAFNERLSTMAASELTFGYGPRACLGRTVAEMVLYKFIPSFFSQLDVALVRPDKAWSIRSSFVEKQSGMDVYLNPRHR
ncbi:cytochrome P450 [Lecanosticta acicola]|uniref:Cytochrome P450 n=1 Tax=Lecanosticta acicola TaxID=111012 RepID=A0AAI9ECP8_9PEZI|nr:cytochrome P450 [Lecanosticta acicola]